jgi:hypothetical protein
MPDRARDLDVWGKDWDRAWFFTLNQLYRKMNEGDIIKAGLDNESSVYFAQVISHVQRRF